MPASSVHCMPHTVCTLASPRPILTLFGTQPLTAGLHARHVRHDFGIKAEVRQRRVQHRRLEDVEQHERQ